MRAWNSVDSGHGEARLGGVGMKSWWKISLLWPMKPMSIYWASVTFEVLC